MSPPDLSKLILKLEDCVEDCEIDGVGALCAEAAEERWHGAGRQGTSLFKIAEVPPIEASKIPPRPYQVEALAALDLHMRTKETNPCVVIPTGGGKSLLIAWAIQAWKRDYPPFRCLILAHRKELVEQNAAELTALWPGGDIGVYSAGLRRRDLDCAITYASIDSMWNRAGEFPPFDLVIVDEAHRIPAKGEGKYLSLIKALREQNKRLRVVGFTATPFRLGMGPICHRDHVLHEIAYEAQIGDLIRDGYLCRLRSKVGTEVPDLSAVEKNGQGDYVQTSLAAAMEVPHVVQHAVREAMSFAKDRKSLVFFCVDVKHCQAVSLELRRYGIDAPVVVASTPAADRDRIAEQFKAGRVRAIANVNVYTEGFNARRVDCIVLLRPTLSAGLYAQMVGRGLRTHPSKADCLVLDYARCIETHGPVDCLEVGEVRTIVCGSVRGPQVEEDAEGPAWPAGCGDTFSRVLGTCPHCGWPIPPQEISREVAEQTTRAERQLHEAEAARLAILGAAEPTELEVDEVTLHRHRKQGSPDSLLVQYRCGVATYREWVTLDHEGFAGAKAQRWWRARFPGGRRVVTVDEALGEDQWLTAAALKKGTKAIRVLKRGKYWEIVGHVWTQRDAD